MNDLAPLLGLGGVAVVAALVQIVKPLLPDERFWPLLAIVFGIVWNVTLGSLTALAVPLSTSVIFGVLSGLAASGAYSGGKTLVGR